MQVSNLVGYIFILAGCSGLGIWYSMQMQRRIQHIKEMIRILDLVSSEIDYGHSTLPECCERIYERTGEPYKSAFQSIYDHLQDDKGGDFCKVSETVLQEALTGSPLKEERDIFIKCFSDVGYADGWLQLQTIERGKKELLGILDTEEEEIKKRSKLAISLGTMSGILLVLILL